MGGLIAMSGRNSLSIRTILVDLTKKIGNLFLLLSRRLDTVEVVVDEEAKEFIMKKYLDLKNINLTLKRLKEI